MTLRELLKTYDSENDRLIIRNRSNQKTIKDLESICLLGEMSGLLNETVARFSVVGTAVDDEGVVCRYSMLINLDIDEYEEPVDEDSDDGYDILDSFGLK